MDEPTKEQIKEFWEKLGFKYVFGKTIRTGEFTEQNYYWESPTGTKYPELPPIDLNNLFKWAVPVVIDKLRKDNFVVPLLVLFDCWHNQIVTLAGTSDTQDMELIILALFRAIQKVIDGNNTPAEH